MHHDTGTPFLASDFKCQTSSLSSAWLNQPPTPPSQAARETARQRQQQLTKPPGSLGRLEQLAVDFAGWQGTPLPRLERVRIRVFAADHGIAAEGVSAFPQAVTVEMIRNFARGGAAISVLARRTGADFGVVNLGTVSPLPEIDANHPAVHDRQLAQGSANICREAAMDEALLAAALAAGAEEATDCDLFIGGEMGIANTATTAALASALLDLSATQTVGTGTGVDNAGLARKRDAVSRALALHSSHCHSPLETLRRLGGLEIAALVGAYIAAAQRGIPSLVDGYICTAAALVACRLNPGVRDWLLFGHRSREPGHRHLLAALDAEPLLDLGLHLGEGSGAATALPLLYSACDLHREMATFAEAAISGSAP
ncbi:MAG: nicotinate-nucleotide--dimethylbenzimidazole phosphoribosyltransferase [Porticoccaceae bacterium]|nr:nicotinate-nucleotide--dimethylbenzimidazole phosphoribosyltransferase [Porticoccaceae bacterium]